MTHDEHTGEIQIERQSLAVIEENLAAQMEKLKVGKTIGYAHQSPS